MRTSRMSLVLSFLTLASCGRDSVPTTIRGVPATLEEMAPSQISAVRDALVAQFVKDAGLGQTEPAVGNENWALVFRAGVYEVSRQCDIYLNDLFRFQRGQRAGQQGLAAIAGTTGAVLGLTHAAAPAIALTAAAFGLISSLFEIGTNSLLYAMEPSALRNVVLQGRQAYLRGVDQTMIRSRPDMLIYLQGYLTQCSPAAIEAGVNNAAAGSPNAVTIGTDEQRQAAAQLAAPALSLLQRAVRVAGPEGQATPTQQPSQTQVPQGWQVGERIVTISDVQRIQRGLGVVNVTGALDEATRRAIQEFQRGTLQRVLPDPWLELDGRLLNRTWREVSGFRTTPPGTFFRSPYERAMFGRPVTYATIDPQRDGMLRAIVARLGIAPARFDEASLTDRPDAARLELLREGIRAARTRTTPAAPAALGDAEALDSDFFAFIRANPMPSPAIATTTGQGPAPQTPPQSGGLVSATP